MVWLEPWAEEFHVPTGSTIVLRSLDDSELGEVEPGNAQFTIWASARKVEVFIDGELQDTASAHIATPEGASRKMLEIMFASQPAARLGGAPYLPEKPPSSFWQKIKAVIFRH